LPLTTSLHRAGRCAAIAALPIKPHIATTLAVTNRSHSLPPLFARETPSLRGFLKNQQFLKRFRASRPTRVNFEVSHAVAE
jgi:hypothetical protein